MATLLKEIARRYLIYIIHILYVWHIPCNYYDHNSPMPRDTKRSASTYMYIGMRGIIPWTFQLRAHEKTNATCIRAAGGVTSRNNFMVECRKSSVWCCEWWWSLSFDWRVCCGLVKLEAEDGVEGTEGHDSDASDGSNSSGVSRRRPSVNFESERIFLLPMILGR